MASDPGTGEAAVQRLWTWLPLLQGETLLEADDGQRVRVLYPGHPNHEPGPDFVGAVVALDGRRAGAAARGAVEVHRRPADWVAHGHHLDPRYNGVLLHVVYEEDDSDPTRAASGRRIPRAALARILPAAPPRPWALPLWGAAPEPFPCRSNTPERIAEVLDLAGDTRFAAMVARWRARLGAGGVCEARTRRPGHAETEDADSPCLRVSGSARHPGTHPPAPCPQIPDLDQLLWEGVAEALGYSRNTAPMRALAARVPLGALREALDRFPPAVRPEVAEACLLGAAGLLPSQRHLGARLGPAAAAYAARLEAHQHALPPELAGATLRGYVWHFGRSRPENAPPRRVAALARIAGRWPAPSMAPAVQAALDQPRPAARRAAIRLRDLLLGSPEQRPLAGDDFWHAHWDFGEVMRPGPRAGALELLGVARAADVVINVLLPFAAALADHYAADDLAGAAWEVYRGHAALAENWITRLVRARLLPEAHGEREAAAGAHQGPHAGEPVGARDSPARPRPGRAARAPTARQQQGLLHIYETVCGDLRCLLCPLNGSGSREPGAGGREPGSTDVQDGPNR